MTFETIVIAHLPLADLGEMVNYVWWGARERRNTAYLAIPAKPLQPFAFQLVIQVLSGADFGTRHAGDLHCVVGGSRVTEKMNGLSLRLGMIKAGGVGGSRATKPEEKGCPINRYSLPNAISVTKI